jgi:hypothetical protein
MAGFFLSAQSWFFRLSQGSFKKGKPMKKIFIVLMLVPWLAFAKGSDTQWVATGKNLRALKALPIQVLLPADASVDYVFFDYSIKEEKTNPNYTAIFLKDASHWYQIESSSELGDVDWEDAITTKIKTELFGEVTLQTSQAVSAGEAIKTPKIISNWMCDKNFPAKKSNLKFRCYQLFGRGISIQDATQIIKSLKATK